MGSSRLEADLLFALRAVGLPEPVTELHFDWCCEHPKKHHGWSPGGDSQVGIPGVDDPMCWGCLRPYIDESVLREWDDARELSFHEYRRGRNWRFDFCWPSEMVAVEVDGATWSAGRHTRGSGFQSDAEKRNRAQLLGWKVLTFTRLDVTSGRALATIEAALKKSSEIHPLP